ncbi:MAG TPA: gamma-glutamyl-gamma-aminobutyrate hydrolase family protein [Bryobacteraceae bacterium]|nr:gamma-glutamyl-gamma-aminobutyrate hydrolase family protein [Bryobacteraceae bacterium]
MLRVALTTSNDTNAQPYEDALRPYFDAERVLPGDTRAATEFAALVLAGGHDINPAAYGEARAPETEKPDDARDELERRMLGEALAADLPVLAICRGAQMLNVATGGKLIQHLPTTAMHRRRGILHAHDVRVREGTRLAEICGAARLDVNSRHHQAISPEHVGAGLLVTATSAGDEVVEAVEMPAHRFVVGVQWHPEDSVGVRESDRRLFAAFAAAVSDRAK